MGTRLLQLGSARELKPNRVVALSVAERSLKDSFVTIEHWLLAAVAMLLGWRSRVVGSGRFPVAVALLWLAFAVPFFSVLLPAEEVAGRTARFRCSPQPP